MWISDIDHIKEKSQLKLDQVKIFTYFDIVKWYAIYYSELQVKIAYTMAKGTEEGLENIMKNV